MADSGKLERERDVARARICRAIAALEEGRPEDALTILKEQGLCDYNRCASLTATHRLLERWIYWVRSVETHDQLVEYDTESFLGGEIFPMECPACGKPLRLACPLPGCKEPLPTQRRIDDYIRRYAVSAAQTPIACAACESSLCIACPSCGRNPLDERLRQLGRKETP